MNALPKDQQWDFQGDNENVFKMMKAQKLNSNFKHVEPLLLEQIELFKTQFKEEISKELELLITQKFAHIDRVKE